MQSKPLLVSIEGNLCSGKSSVLSQIKSHFGDECITFPDKNESLVNFTSGASTITQILRWGHSMDGFNLNENAFNYPSIFAVILFLERFSSSTYNQIVAKQSFGKKLAVVEQSTLSAIDVFASVATNHIYPTHKQMIDRINETFQPITPKPDLMIFLEASPNLLYQRIAERARPEDSCVTIEYLQAIELRYHNLRAIVSSGATPVFIVQTDHKSIEDVHHQVLSIISNYI